MAEKYSIELLPEHIAEIKKMENNSSIALVLDNKDKVNVKKEGEEIIFTPPRNSYGQKITVDISKLV